VKAVFPWLLSAGTLGNMWLVGNKNKLGWVVGLANQALWITFIVLFSAWGLLPLALALIVLYTRNLVRWRREELASSTCPPPDPDASRASS